MFECDFESEDICGMRQDGVPSFSRDFDWTRHADQTPMANTGPSFAASGHYYMYIDSRHPRSPGDQAL